MGQEEGEAMRESGYPFCYLCSAGQCDRCVENHDSEIHEKGKKVALDALERIVLDYRKIGHPIYVDVAMLLNWINDIRNQPPAGQQEGVVQE